MADKITVKVEMLVELKEGKELPSEDVANAAAEEAVWNALRESESNGFNHGLSSSLTFRFLRVRSAIPDHTSF